MRFVCCVMILAGMVIAGYGTYLSHEQVRFLDRSVEVEGVVIRLEGSNVGYAPVVAYRDHLGEERILYSAIHSRPPQFFVGEKVPVRFDPDDPEFPLHAQIGTTGQSWFLPVFMLVFGSFLILLPAGMLYLDRRVVDPSDAGPVF